MTVEKVTDFELLKRMWELSRLEKSPTAQEIEEFHELKGQLEQSMEKALTLEDRTRRLVRHLMAA